MAATFNGFGHAGRVEVKRQIVGSGHVWTLIFLTRLGALPAVTVNAAEDLTCSAGAPDIVALETHPGSLPAMDSSDYGSYELSAGLNDLHLSHTITGLAPGEAYHVRVSAWNGVGNAYGATQYCTPAFVAPSQQPDAPQTSKSEVVSDTEIDVSWTVPLRDGSAAVHAYRVEWDTNSGAPRGTAHCSVQP